METLTPTTKELIFEKIITLKEKIALKDLAIEKSHQKNINEDFIEFWQIEIELMHKQIEDLKQILFFK